MAIYTSVWTYKFEWITPFSSLFGLCYKRTIYILCFIDLFDERYFLVNHIGLIIMLL